MDNNEFDARLAGLLQNYPAIWNRKSAAFKNRTLKENNFKQLARHLNVSAQVCEERYRSLREKYRKEKLKDEAGRVGQCGERWELFDSLSFLNEQILTRKKRVTTYLTDEPPQQAEDPAKIRVIVKEPADIIQSEDFMMNDDQCTDPLSDTLAALNTPSGHSAPSSISTYSEEDHLGAKRPKLEKENEESPAVVNGFARGPASSSSEARSRFTWLGRYIAETLNSMSHIDAEETAHEITELLYRKKMQSMQNR